MSDISTTDIAWMREALALAAEADLPFGTVIVKDGAVLARGGNSGKRRGDPTAHGEMMAIAECVAAHGAEALQGATLYTSGEPCPMCMGAILWSRFWARRLCRVDRRTEHQARADHGALRRDRRADPVPYDRDHRRCPG